MTPGEVATMLANKLSTDELTALRAYLDMGQTGLVHRTLVTGIDAALDAAEYGKVRP